MKDSLKILLLFLVCIISCGKESIDPAQNLLLGKWIPIKIVNQGTNYPNGPNVGFAQYTKYTDQFGYYIFQENGIVRHNLLVPIPYSYKEVSYPYQVNGKTLEYYPSGGSAITLKIDKLTSSGLTLYLRTEGGALYETWYYYVKIPDCPCKYEEAKKMGNTKSPNGEWSDCGKASQSYHLGATSEVRWFPNESGDSGQQCTYDISGNLITGGIGAGSFDRVSPRACGFVDGILTAGVALEHKKADVDTWKELPCKQYLRDWPANNGLNCSSNIINGITHMSKMVGDMTCEEITILIMKAKESPNLLIDADLRNYIIGNPVALTNEQLKTKLMNWKNLNSCSISGGDICKVIDKTLKNLTQ
jgi:hypothetical protein